MLRPPPAQANTRRTGNWLGRKGTLSHERGCLQTTSQGTYKKHCNKQVSLGGLQDKGQNERKMYFYKLSTNNRKCIQIFTIVKNKHTNMKFNTVHIWSIENYQTLRRRGKDLNKWRDLCAHRLSGWPIPIRPTTLRVGRGLGGGGTDTPPSPKATWFLDSRLFPGISKPKLTITNLA